MVESHDDITQVLAVPTVGRFTDLTRIGEGGMGVLYKAFDPKLKRSIALKFLHKPTTLDPDSETRFLNEARAAAAGVDALTGKVDALAAKVDALPTAAAPAAPMSDADKDDIAKRVADLLAGRLES